MEFRILGPVEARVGERVIDLGGGRQRALLALLLLRRGEPVSPDMLLEDLWSGRPPQSAERAVHVVVSRLRRGLESAGDRLSRTPAGYRFAVEPGELDLDRFERLREDGRRALREGDAERGAERLRAALAEWHGPPLGGVAFEAFAQAEAARLESLRDATLEDRVEADLLCGRGLELISELEELVARNPLRERTYGQLMRALYRAGRQGDALEVYRSAVRAFDSELGLRLGPELEHLQKAILAHDPALRGSERRLAVTSQSLRPRVPVPRALCVWPSGPFAGRADELLLLRTAWAEAEDGRRRAVLISGDPGIGKTQLTAELAREAASAGATVLYGRCDEGIAAPVQPFAEALDTYSADDLHALIGDRTADLVSVLPGLAARSRGVASAAPGAPDVEQLRMFEALAALIRAASCAAPVLLVLDDLHWADELSLMLVRHLLRTDEAMRLLVLATYRDTEPSRSPMLGELVTGLARRPDVSRLQLGPLDMPDVAAILAAAGREPSLAGRVRTATEGNPFFVGEVVRVLGDIPDPARALTPRARDVVRWRLARLPAGTAEVLEAAAVTGAEFDADVAAEGAGVDINAALDALAAAEHARLVRVAGRLDRFMFAHALLRQTILDDLAAGQRVRLHARVARSLERATARRAVPAGDLAVHFAAAGGLVDAATTLRVTRAAAEEAAARLAFDVAAQHYEQALEALVRLPKADAETKLTLELDLGRALRLAGDARADRILRQAARDAEAAGDGSRMAEASLSIALDIETRFLSEDTGMVGLLHRALAILPEADSPARARLFGLLALEAIHSLSDRERHALAERAIEMARRTGDAIALASTLTVRSWLLIGREPRRARLTLGQELAALARPELPYAECDGHVFQYSVFAERGERAAAEAALTAARAAAHVPVARWTATQWTATNHLLAGRLDEAEAHAVQGAELGREAGFPPAAVQIAFASVLWCLRAIQGRLAELETLYRTGDDWMLDRPPWTGITEAQLCLATNDRDGARQAFDTAFTGGELGVPSGFSWQSTLIFASDVCATLADQARAAQLRDMLEPEAGTMSITTGPVDRALGRLAFTLGHRDEAEHRMREAVALCERMDARAFLAWARFDLAELCGDTDEERRLVEQARIAAEELGMPGLATRARRYVEQPHGKSS